MIEPIYRHAHVIGNVAVTTTWGRINPKAPSAWESASAHYEQDTGKSFDALEYSARIQYVRDFVNR